VPQENVDAFLFKGPSKLSHSDDFSTASIHTCERICGALLLNCVFYSPYPL